MKTPSIPTNPLVEKLLAQRAAGIIEVVGYPAPQDKGPIRIYRDLNLEKYIEIPVDALLLFSELEDPQSPCRVFFKSDAVVTYTTKRQVSASAEVTSTLSVRADEVKRTARSRVIQSGLRCPCSTSTNEISAMRSISAGPKLPPLWCEINCEQMYNQCLDAGMSPFWCWIGYYLCLQDCKGDSFGGGVIIV